jgi:hypothetical protein
MKLWSATPRSWGELFDLIQEVPSGREVWRRFRDQLSSGQVRLEAYPEEVKRQLQSLVKVAAPLGAAFTTDGIDGTVFLDASGNFGILAPCLLHEMIHSLDETLWRAGRHSLPSSQLRSLIFDAECRAFAAQHRFLEELRGRYPDYRSFCELSANHLPGFNRQLLPDEIARLYGAIHR